MKNFSYNFFTTTATAWEAMLEALRTARRSIAWELYALADDQAGRPFIDVLCAQAQSGLEVKIILDWIGSWSLSRPAEMRLRQAGVDVVWYNRPTSELHPLRFWRRLFYRNHRKVLVVDGEIAFLGGVNVEQAASAWDDLHVRLSGTAVSPLQRGFARSYLAAGGQRRAIKHLLQRPWAQGLSGLKNKIQFILHSPLLPRERHRLRQWYRQAIVQAKKKITLLSPYYVPDQELMELLTAARARGVAVEVIIPWRSDHRLMDLLAQHYYTIMARAGAALYFGDNMNHAKALLVDGMQALVGSVNATNRSFAFNEEAGIIVSDTAMVRDLSRIVEQWKAKARIFSAATLPPLTAWRRLAGWAAYALRGIV